VVGVAVGVADGALVRPTVLVGVGCAVGRAERRGVEVAAGVGVATGTVETGVGVGVTELTT